MIKKQNLILKLQNHENDIKLDQDKIQNNLIEYIKIQTNILPFV